MAYDKSDFHFGDAGSWEKACRHIALFFYWASERGLTDPNRHPDRKAIAKDPVSYFMSHCDDKLLEHDFSHEGRAVAEEIYDEYLRETSTYAATLGVSDYDIPDDARSRDHFFHWLDERLEVRRERSSKSTSRRGKSTSKPGTKAKPMPKRKKRPKRQ